MRDLRTVLISICEIDRAKQLAGALLTKVDADRYDRQLCDLFGELGKIDQLGGFGGLEDIEALEGLEGLEIGSRMGVLIGSLMANPGSGE